MQHQQTWQDKLNDKIQENSRIERESERRIKTLEQQVENQEKVKIRLEKEKCQLETQNRQCLDELESVNKECEEYRAKSESLSNQLINVQLQIERKEGTISELQQENEEKSKVSADR